MWLALLFELRKHLRRRRLLIAVALSLAVPALFYAVPAARGTAFAASPDLFAGSNLGFMGLLILICAAFFGGDAISSELDKRTFLVSYVSPQRRMTVFAGKFMAAFIATAAMVMLYYGVIVSESGFIYGWNSMPGPMTTSLGVSLLYAMAALSVTFTFSSVMKSTITSNLLSFFVLMLILPIVSAILSFTGIDPWFVPTYYSSLITQVFGTVSLFGPGEGGGGPPGAFSFVPDFATGLNVLAASAVVLTLLSALITSRRQME